MRVADLEVGAAMREPFVAERREEQVDGLLVLRPRVLVERDAGLLRDPPVAPADTPLVAAAIGLWYGRTWSMVRKRIFRVLCAAAAKSAVGFAEIENFGKKKCSIDA